MLFSNEHVTLSITEDKNTGMLMLEGSLKQPSLYSKRVVFAANPIDRMTNYSGSGLPFPNNTIAFENSPNYYEVGNSGEIKTMFYKPNSYYATDTYTRVVPSIFIKLINEEPPIIIQFKLKDPLPLQGRKEKPDGPAFYAKKADIIGIRGQYEIIKMIQDVKTRYNCA